MSSPSEHKLSKNDQTPDSSTNTVTNTHTPIPDIHVLLSSNNSLSSKQPPSSDTTTNNPNTTQPPPDNNDRQSLLPSPFRNITPPGQPSPSSLSTSSTNPIVTNSPRRPTATETRPQTLPPLPATNLMAKYSYSSRTESGPIEPRPTRQRQQHDDPRIAAPLFVPPQVARRQSAAAQEAKLEAEEEAAFNKQFQTSFQKSAQSLTKSNYNDPVQIPLPSSAPRFTSQESSAEKSSSSSSSLLQKPPSTTQPSLPLSQRRENTPQLGQSLDKLFCNAQSPSYPNLKDNMKTALTRYASRGGGGRGVPIVERPESGAKIMKILQRPKEEGGEGILVRDFEYEGKGIEGKEAKK